MELNKLFFQTFGSLARHGFPCLFLLLSFIPAISAAGVKSEAVITAATYNVSLLPGGDGKPEHQWPQRAPRCRQIIKQNHLDIFGLQEPYRMQIDDLIRGTDYAFIGKGRDDFKNLGEFSCIVYRKSRFKVLKSGTFGLSEKPEQPGLRSWKSNCPRIATWGVFLDQNTGKKFVYCNTHLDHVSSLARVNGIKLILSRAGKYAKGLPLMISGDFNSAEGSKVYKLISGKLRDSAKISETPHQGPEYSFNGWGRWSSGKPIDFIFLSPEFRVLSHRIDGTSFDGSFASDHFPVIIQMVLK